MRWGAVLLVCGVIGCGSVDAIPEKDTGAGGAAGAAAGGAAGVANGGGAGAAAAGAPGAGGAAGGGAVSGVAGVGGGAAGAPGLTAATAPACAGALTIGNDWQACAERAGGQPGGFQCATGCVVDGAPVVGCVASGVTYCIAACGDCR
jgi:hypothetical protein